MTAPVGRSWLDWAACAASPGLPWTADAVEVSAGDAAIMRGVCGACPVLEVCRAAADEWGVTAGWWGGTQREPSQPALPPSSWVVIRVGRAGRVLPGVLQGVLDFGDAA